MPERDARIDCGDVTLMLALSNERSMSVLVAVNK